MAIISILRGLKRRPAGGGQALLGSDSAGWGKTVLSAVLQAVKRCLEKAEKLKAWGWIVLKGTEMRVLKIRGAEALLPVCRCGTRRFCRSVHSTGSEEGFMPRGFTMVEILIVVVVMAIAAMIAIPMVSSADSLQVSSAANTISADIEYAKSMAIKTGRTFSVVFDSSTESYRIEDQDDNVIEHPVKKGFDYIVDFRAESRLDKVNIVSADFDSTSEVKFDYLGSPYNGGDVTLNSGLVTLSAGSSTATVSVEPVTGFIVISD